MELSRTQTPSFDTKWDELYEKKLHVNRYVHSEVVSFISRYRPSKPQQEVSVLEVGCGTCPNICYLAESGYITYGVDASASAISIGKAFLKEKNLHANLYVTDFTTLDFPNEYFDIVIDRAALTHANMASVKMAINEIARVLKKGGHFLFTPFSDSHPSCLQSTLDENLTSTKIHSGYLSEFKNMTFIGRKEVDALFRRGWILQQCDKREVVDMLNGKIISADWFIVAEKDNYR